MTLTHSGHRPTERKLVRPMDHPHHSPTLYGDRHRPGGGYWSRHMRHWWRASFIGLLVGPNVRVMRREPISPRRWRTNFGHRLRGEMDADAYPKSGAWSI